MSALSDLCNILLTNEINCITKGYWSVQNKKHQLLWRGWWMYPCELLRYWPYILKKKKKRSNVVAVSSHLSLWSKPPCLYVMQMELLPLSECELCALYMWSPSWRAGLCTCGRQCHVLLESVQLRYKTLSFLCSRSLLIIFQLDLLNDRASCNCRFAVGQKNKCLSKNMQVITVTFMSID